MNTRPLIVSLIVAAIVWAIMFSPLTAPHIYFWATMAPAAVLLCHIAVRNMPGLLRRLHFTPANIALGVLMAAALWLAFYIGDWAAAQLFSFARPEVGAIYGIREGVSPIILSALLIALIGPAEELYWRGYVQETLTRRLGANAGFIIATALYPAVHIPSCNFMLIMASLVAGVFWGLAYRLMPRRLAAIVISHALWDAAIFIWFPINA